MQKTDKGNKEIQGENLLPCRVKDKRRVFLSTVESITRWL